MPDTHLDLMATMAARVEAAALVALDAALRPIFDDSQLRAPEKTGLLKSTELLQIEADGGEIKGRISYGSPETVRTWGGAESAGFGGRRGSRRRQQGALWADVGYEIFVHEGVFDSMTGTHPPNKFLEGPVMDAEPALERTLGEAFQKAMENGL